MDKDKLEELREYNKIYILGSSSNQEITNYKEDEIVIEEKIDGSNFRFWREGDRIVYGSRKVKDVRPRDGWGKQIEYLNKKLDVNALGRDIIYVGEAMKKHIVNYDFDNHPPFIGFDLLDKETGMPLDYKVAKKTFESLGLEFVNILFEGTMEEYLGMDRDKLLEISKYNSKKPEGYVIKNYNRLSQYNEPLFAKVLNDEYLERQKAKAKKPKPKETDTPLAVELYVNEARIKKMIAKMVVDEGHKLERTLMHKLIPRVIKDFLRENILEIYEDNRIKDVNFNILHKEVPKRCIKVLDKMIESNAF